MTASMHLALPDGGRPAAHTDPRRVSLQVADPLVAAGLRRWIRGADRLAIAYEAAGELVVVAPGPMPTAWLRRAVDTTRQDAPDALVLLIGDVTDDVSADEVGADAVLARAQLDERRFTDAVRGLLEGRLDAVPDEDEATGPADRRAATVLAMLADGCDLAEIAATLFYSERTVKNVLYGYLGEVGARNRVHAVACAIRSGLV